MIEISCLTDCQKIETESGVFHFSGKTRNQWSLLTRKEKCVVKKLRCGGRYMEETEIYYAVSADG